MKNLIKVAFLMTVFLGTTISTTKASEINQKVVTDTVLYDAQSKIEKALLNSFKSGKIEPFNVLERQFNVSNNTWKPYWNAYLGFYKSIYYLKVGDKVTCEKVVKDGISQLEKIAKTSEEYALLAYLQSFSVQFHKGMEAGFVSSKVKKNADKAIALNAKNIRAYFVLGSNDFYTPAAFGGGRKVEEYLTKAISISEKQTQDRVLPSWGKDSAYEMLIKFYIKQKKTDLAKKYFADAQKLYPKNYAINDLGKQIVL